MYISTYAAPTLYQFDLSSMIPSVIIASQTGLSITPDIYGLQLAPNGIIYAVKSFSQFLGVVDSPDVAGPSCHYVDNGIYLDPLFLGHTAALTLPGFDQSLLKQQEGCFPAIINKLQQSQFKIYPNPSSNGINIKSRNGFHHATAMICDISGRIVQSTILTSTKGEITHIGLDNFSGIFFIRITDEGFEETFKIILIE